MKYPVQMPRKAREDEEHKLCRRTAKFLYTGETLQWPGTRLTTFHLLDDHFLLELKRLNDTPREVLENPDRMELFLRVVRADFEWSRPYEYQPRGDLMSSAWCQEECSHENGRKNMKIDPAFVFHLAIPSADLDRSAEFYTGLGCRIARRYDDRVTLEFFGHQVVCHFSPDQIDLEPRMYPRHFGITCLQKTQFEYILAKAKKNQLAFFCEPFIRFKGKREEHCTFLLKDPSNNLLEFKYYDDSAMVY